MKKVRAGSLAVLLLPALSAGALEITSAAPAASAKGKTADFVFSGPITVKNIAFEKNAVVMPVTGYKDREYADIRLLSKSLYGKLESCFSKDKCAIAVKAPAPRLTVLEVKQLKSKTRVANVTLAFDGELSVTFGVIRKASGEIWAAYPANFEVKDRILKGLIEKKVKEGFNTARADTKK